MLRIHGCLTGERPEYRGCKSGMAIEQSEQSAERNRRDYRLGKSGHRVQRFLKKSTGKADKIPRQGDVQYLPASIVKDPVANRDSVDQYEQHIVFLPLRQDFAVAANSPGC